MPPMNLVDGGDDGISIILHFGRDKPRKHVTAIVVTIISKMTDALTDLELKAVVPKGMIVNLLLLQYLGVLKTHAILMLIIKAKLYTLYSRLQGKTSNPVIKRAPST